MILTCSHLSKSFGTDMLFRDGTFRIEEKEKAAIVGINGAGKSTLLKIIMGDSSGQGGYHPDGGRNPPPGTGDEARRR